MTREKIYGARIEVLPSNLGDVILQRDELGRRGNVVKREVVMFTPTKEIPKCLRFLDC